MKAKRRSRYNKDLQEQKWARAGVPKGITKCITVLTVDGQVPLGASVSHRGVELHFVPDDASNNDPQVFELPRKISSPEAEGVKITNWHKTLDERHKAAEAVREQKTKSVLKKIVEKGVAHGCAHLLDTAFPVNPDGATVFDPALATPTFLFVQNVCEQLTTCEAFPFLGVSGFLTVYVGNFFVIILSIENVVNASCENVAGFLIQEPSQLALLQAPTFVLGPNDSLWLPFGSVLVIVGVPPAPEAEKTSG